ncbi:MAG: hypothetical protein KDB79_01180 [Acidobacteria bacterium]|nr:hypothetical protein [Acidobacteriota bacterium]
MKALKKFNLVILLSFALSISVNAQKDIQAGMDSEAMSSDVAKINELVPVKEGTTLKKIGSDGVLDRSIEMDDTGASVSKQTQGYIRPTSKQRFNRYLDGMFVKGLIGVGASSVVQQIAENPPEWEQNGKGFLRRVGSNFAENIIEESVAYGLEETLKLDSKFYKSKKKDFGSRVKNAFLSSFTARTPSGKRVFNPSRIAGRYTADIIATETWFPKRFSYKDGLRHGTRGIGFDIGLNFLREFIFPK